MCLALLGIGLEAVVLGAALMGNSNNAWKKSDDNGGLWMYCVGGTCTRYNGKEADLLKHDWHEVIGARAMMLISIAVGAPVVIVMFIAMCIGCCTLAPFYAGAMLGSLQTTCMIIGCALMTHGFVTGRPHLKYELGQSLWLAWGGTQFGILLTAVLCTAGCDCWKKCEIKPKKKKGKKEEGKDKESKRKDVEKSSHGNQFGKSSKSAESGKSNEHSQIEKSSKDAESGKSNKNSQSEKSSKQAENEKITQEGQNTAKISESPHYVTSREIYHQQSGSDLQLKDSLKKEPQDTVTKMDKTAKNGQAGKGGTCTRYNGKEADLLKHDWHEVIGARAMMLISIAVGAPVVIVMFIAMCIGCCTLAPFYAGAMLGALQTTCMIIGCALMTHGFVTGRPHLKYELGQSLWLAWGGTQFGILLTAVLCTAGCDCWKKCEIKPKKKKGKKEEGKDKESKRKDVEKSSHGNQFGKSSKSAESGKSNKHSQIEKSSKDAESGKSNKNSQSEKSSKQAENEKITQEGQNTAKISESPHYVTSREIYHQQSGSDLQLKDSLKKEPQDTVTKMDKTAKNGQAGKAQEKQPEQVSLDQQTAKSSDETLTVKSIKSDSSAETNENIQHDKSPKENQSIKESNDYLTGKEEQQQKFNDENHKEKVHAIIPKETPVTVTENDVGKKDAPKVHSIKERRRKRIKRSKTQSRERSKNRSRDVSKKRSRDLSRKRSRDLSKKRSRDLSKKRSRDLSKKRSRDLSKKRSRDLSKKRSRDLSKKPSRDLSKKRSRDLSKKPSRDLSKKRSRDLSKKRSRDLSKKPSRDLSKKPSRDLSKKPSRDLSKKPSRDLSKQRSREPSKEPLPSTEAQRKI